MNNTNTQYDALTSKCLELFVKKAQDYGTAWRILRLTSITDQLFIKAQRIRTIEEKGISMVDESIESEYTAIINYCIIALIQLSLRFDEELELPLSRIEELYKQHLAVNKQLMEEKNHDYGEAWRDMRITSITDLILMKLLRIKQIEDNSGITLVSEGVEANYRDILNYAVFALIRLSNPD